MDYRNYEKFVIDKLSEKSLWSDKYSLKVNDNNRGQSKSIFVVNGEQKIFIAKFFTYTKDNEIDIASEKWEEINNMNDYILFLESNPNCATNVEMIIELLQLRKRCFGRYILASNMTTNIFPKIFYYEEEIKINNTICGFIVEKAINGITLEDYMRSIDRKKEDMLDIGIKFLDIISLKMCGYFEHNFVHRDLSPDNIMIKFGIEIDYIIIDPGVVKIVGSTSTKSGLGLCKRLYSSPEQFLGNASKVDFTSDIYTLGIVIYELITGINLINLYDNNNKMPHKEISMKIDRDVEDMFYSSIKIDSDKAGNLYLIIRKMLQFKNENRYNTPESFRESISVLVEGDD
ncbi:MAG: protein kinase [Bacilli bacterium]|nr:protein kinase [Bacilli bacterium]